MGNKQSRGKKKGNDDSGAKGTSSERQETEDSKMEFDEDLHMDLNRTSNDAEP